MERFFEWIGLRLYKFFEWIGRTLCKLFTNKYAVLGLLVCFAFMFIITLVVAAWVNIGAFYGIPLVFGFCMALLYAYWTITWE